MKLKMLAISIFLGFMVVGALCQSEVVLERKMPAGWILRKAAISSSGEKALFFFQDLPQEVRLTGHFPKRLQIFDKNNNSTADFIIEDDYWLSDITRDSRIILTKGDENSVQRVKVVDLKGNELFSIPSEGRFPEPALLGKEIALVPRQGQVGPISIIDDETGRENLRFERVSVKPEIANNICFRSIGEDGMFIEGIGAALALKSYLNENKDLWRLPDIGGNIKDCRFLDDELLVVEYERNDFRSDKLHNGIIVLLWRTGEICFRKEGSQIAQKPDPWFYRLSTLNILSEDGDLVFLGDEGRGVLIPKKAGIRKEWDIRSQKNVMRADQPENLPDGRRVYRPTINGKYVINIIGETLRIQKLRFVEGTK
jgi:hypothetical protein